MPQRAHAQEHWKPIPGFESSYEVSDLGHIRSGLTGKTLKPWMRGRYLGISLRRDGKTHSRYVHQVVTEVFLGPRPEGLETCHENGDRFDNRAVNLRYDTHHANMRDTLTHGTHRSLAKTTCAHGHLLTPENVYRRSFRSADGGTKYRDRCKTCIAEKRRREHAERNTRGA